MAREAWFAGNPRIGACRSAVFQQTSGSRAMTSRRAIVLVLATILSLVSCGKPKELAYKSLGYTNGILTEPGSNVPFTGVARDSYKDGKPKAEYPCRNGKFQGTVKE